MPYYTIGDNTIRAWKLTDDDFKAFEFLSGKAAESNVSDVYDPLGLTPNNVTEMINKYSEYMTEKVRLVSTCFCTGMCPTGVPSDHLRVLPLFLYKLRPLYISALKDYPQAEPLYRFYVTGGDIIVTDDLIKIARRVVCDMPYRTLIFNEIFWDTLSPCDALYEILESKETYCSNTR